MLPSIFSYLPEQGAQLLKVAEQAQQQTEESDLPPRTPRQVKEPSGWDQAKGFARVAVPGALGIGAGTALGGGLAYGIDKLYQHQTGRPIPTPTLLKALPLLGAAMGVAKVIHDQRQQQEFRRVLDRSE